ncbi:MAG: hypothetical protein ACFFDW_06745 [Candidatus Thorarchaeota archaeon]
MNSIVNGKNTINRGKEDTCVHMSEGIQKIVPPEIVEKLLSIITTIFDEDFSTIFITNSVNKRYYEGKMLFLPVSEIDKFYSLNSVATKIISKDRSKRIIHIRLAIERNEVGEFDQEYLI